MYFAFPVIYSFATFTYYVVLSLLRLPLSAVKHWPVVSNHMEGCLDHRIEHEHVWFAGSNLLTILQPK